MKSRRLALAGVALGVVVALVGVIAHFGSFANPLSEVYGDIYVDQPEIYTRERLVNDRVKQDEWLRGRLNATDALTFSTQGSIKIATRRSTGSTTALGAEPGDAGASPAQVDADAGAPLQQAPIDDLRDRLAYRDEVRSEIIENQLDDSHDIAGNTLYHLKFDTAIVPREGATAYAMIAAAVSSTYSGIALNCDDENGLIQPPEFDRCIQKFLKDHSRTWGSGSPSKPAPSQSASAEVMAQAEAAELNTTAPLEKLSQLYAVYLDWLDRASGKLNGVVAQYRDPILTALRLPTAPTAPTAPTGKPGGTAPVSTQQATPKLNDLDAANLARFDGYLRGVMTAKSAAGNKAGAPKICADEGGTSAAPLLLNINCFLTAQPNQAAGAPLDLESALKEQFANWLAADAEWFAQKTGQDLLTQYRPFAQLTADNGKLKVLPRTVAVDGEPQPWLADAARYKFADAVLQGGTPDGTARANPTVSADDATSNNTAPSDASATPDAGAPSPGQGGKVASPVKFSHYERSLGFVEFLTRLLRSANHAYTYSVQPKESAQRVASVRESQTVSSLVLGASATLDANALKSVLSDSASRAELANAIERHPLIIGFSDDAFHGPTDLGAYFGWLIGPRFRSGARAGQPTFEQQPVHNSVAAIVSAPSWWRSMRVAVITYWLTSSGACIDSRWGKFDCSELTRNLKDGVEALNADKGQKGGRFEVQLPGDQDSIEDVLFNSGRRNPQVLTDKMDAAWIRAGEDANIVIPGRSLWRGTMVTLGNNYTNDITVLPDMNGIIAHFKKVPWPPNLDVPAPKSQYLPLDVWTSEGRAQIGWYKVVIFPPDSAASPPAPKPVAAPTQATRAAAK